MKDEQLINYASNKEKLSSQTRATFEEFLSINPQLTEVRIEISSHQPPSKSEKQQKNELQKLIQKIAVQYNLDETLIANGKSLIKFIRGDQSVKFLAGWRYHILKEELKNAK
jgi:hypothetical protein